MNTTTYKERLKELQRIIEEEGKETNIKPKILKKVRKRAEAQKKAAKNADKE